MRVLLQEERRWRRARLEPPDLDAALPSMKGEVFSSRALALATIGRVGEATELATRAAALTSGIETQALCAAVAAVCALKERTDRVLDRCDALIEHVFATGSLDIAVTAYRANPDLLATVMASSRMRDQIVYLLRRAGDEERARGFGRVADVELVDPASTLSNREREVYQLICEGLSNAEIARQLYIYREHCQGCTFTTCSTRSESDLARALALNAAHGRYATSTNCQSVLMSVRQEGNDSEPVPRAAL